MIPNKQDRARAKLALCVRLARECNQAAIATGDWRFGGLRDEAMRDARYWRDELRRMELNELTERHYHVEEIDRSEVLAELASAAWAKAAS